MDEARDAMARLIFLHAMAQLWWLWLILLIIFLIVVTKRKGRRGVLEQQARDNRQAAMANLNTTALELGEKQVAPATSGFLEVNGQKFAAAMMATDRRVIFLSLTPGQIASGPMTVRWSEAEHLNSSAHGVRFIRQAVSYSFVLDARQAQKLPDIRSMIDTTAPTSLNSCTPDAGVWRCLAPEARSRRRSDRARIQGSQKRAGYGGRAATRGCGLR